MEYFYFKSNNLQTYGICKFIEHSEVNNNVGVVDMYYIVRDSYGTHFKKQLDGRLPLFSLEIADAPISAYYIIAGIFRSVELNSPDKVHMLYETRDVLSIEIKDLINRDIQSLTEYLVW